MPGVSSQQPSVKKQDTGPGIRSFSREAGNSKVRRIRETDNLKEHQLLA